jgi:type IV fimbrial biogenesis protein FimT
MNTRLQRGVSTVEAAIALAIVLVSAGASLPGFLQMAERHRLEGAAAQLETQLQFARASAVARNENVRVTFQTGARSACYVVHTGPARACDCTQGPAVCSGGAEALASQVFDDASKLRMGATASSILFDATKGTVTPTATVELNGSGGQTVRLVVNVMGRIRACSTTGLRGYKAC